MLVNVPFDPKEFENGTESLISFYKELGWDPNKNELDPKKVVINSKDADACLSYLMKSSDDMSRISIGLLWIDKGPSHAEDVPSGKVRLMSNWLN